MTSQAGYGSHRQCQHGNASLRTLAAYGSVACPSCGDVMSRSKFLDDIGRETPRAKELQKFDVQFAMERNR